MNLEQKHFPMLREYEKAKMQMMNTDLSEQTVHFNNTQNAFAAGNQTLASMSRSNLTGRSPFSNFVRSTAGKKLYFNDPKSGPLPPARIQDQTRISETRQRILYRADNGAPLHRVQRVKDFIPCCPSEAKTSI